MSKWLNNLLSYDQEQNKGNCPCCNSSKVKVEETTHNNRKSISFICEDCQATDHFDGFTE